MSLRARSRRHQARAKRFEGCFVIHEPGARVADVWLRPGAFTREQVCAFVNASSEIVRAELHHAPGTNGGLMLHMKPEGWAVLRASAEKVGVVATVGRYGVTAEDVEKALAGGGEP
jgi:hypothetical protein